MEGLYALLSPICASVEVWEATYLHVMTSVAAIVELMEATSLAPFLAPLDPSERRKFVARYAAELEEAYPAEPDGSVLLRLRRLFVLAQSRDAEHSGGHVIAGTPGLDPDLTREDVAIQSRRIPSPSGSR